MKRTLDIQEYILETIFGIANINARIARHLLRDLEKRGSRLWLHYRLFISLEMTRIVTYNYILFYSNNNLKNAKSD